MVTNIIVLEDTDKVVQMKSNVLSMQKEAEKLRVIDDASYKKITSLYSDARSLKKAVDIYRKDLTEPLRKKVSSINDKAKELTDPLDRVIAIANEKSSAYIKMIDEEKEEMSDFLGIQDESCLPIHDRIIRGEGAVAITNVKKEFRVVDITKVPEKYLMVNEDAIEQDMKLGIANIPGIEIFETKTTTLRVR